VATRERSDRAAEGFTAKQRPARARQGRRAAATPHGEGADLEFGAQYPDPVFDEKDSAAQLELPEVVGDATLFDTGESKFVIACISSGVWSIRRAQDPLYLGELCRVGTLFDYEARAGAIRISMTGLSLQAWAGNL
jgi:hypothetical protein